MKTVLFVTLFQRDRGYTHISKLMCKQCGILVTADSHNRHQNTRILYGDLSSSFIISIIDFFPKKCSWLPLVARTHFCVLMWVDSDRLLNIIYPEICKIYFRPITGSYLLLHKEWTTPVWRINFYCE